MEAPEKLYILFNHPYTVDYTKLNKRRYDEEVEYIRADLVDSMLQMSSHPSKRDIKKEIFVEKACNILANCIEDFMLRRMEIWDKECKKQTLENIRKKLLE